MDSDKFCLLRGVHAVGVPLTNSGRDRRQADRQEETMEIKSCRRFLLDGPEPPEADGENVQVHQQQAFLYYKYLIDTCVF